MTTEHDGSMQRPRPLQTTHCVQCRANATQWCGHVVRADEVRIIAGWCSDHVSVAAGPDAPPGGCFGAWDEAMGAAPWGSHV